MRRACASAVLAVVLFSAFGLAAVSQFPNPNVSPQQAVRGKLPPWLRLTETERARAPERSMFGTLPGQLAEGDSAFGDLLPSEHGAFEDDVHLDLQQESIRRAVGELPEPQQSVIRRRYGIGTGRPESLYQVARELHMGPRRVRDLEADGLAQLARRRELDGLGEAA